MHNETENRTRLKREEMRDRRGEKVDTVLCFEMRNYRADYCLS